MVYARQVNEDNVPPLTRKGRKRTPSEFDSLVRNAYREWLVNPYSAWYAVSYDGTLHSLEALRRELDRAVQHIGKGRDVRVGRDRRGMPTMWYQVRDRRRRGGDKNGKGRPVL